jgi:thymidine kinase
MTSLRRSLTDVAAAASAGAPKRQRVSSAGRRGRVQLILGPMMSGKSSELIRRIRRHALAGNCVYVLKYAKDTRYSDAELSAVLDDVVSHDNIRQKALLVTGDADDFAIGGPLFEVLVEADVVAVDEGQFMTALPAFALALAARGVIVMVAALPGKFNRQPWDVVSSLVALASDIQHLKAICGHCREDDAEFSFRLDRGNQADEVIGGADQYVPLCLGCFDRASV